jgi:hypothetical protein
MDALAEVRNEEIRLHDAGFLQSATVLVARSLAGCSSSARPAAPVPLASSLLFFLLLVASVDLHCDHCGRDGHVEAFCYRKKKAGHVEAFCYRKKKAQAHRSSQGTGSGGSERSYACSETQEILMLLRRLAHVT